jgi:outer membrane receptor protein involved in Fe transport
VVWAPHRDLRVRATWGESFRAPALTEVFERPLIGATLVAEGSAQRLTVLTTGGNPDLRPETATNSTVGIDWTPAATPGLRLSATVFGIEFTDRIGQPALENVAGALTDPSLAPFVDRVDATNPADLARVRALVENPAFLQPGLFPAEAYQVIVDGRYVNTSTVTVRGADLTATYGFERGPDRFTVEGSATWFADYDRRLTPAAATERLVDTVGFPVDFRGRVSGDWTRGPATTRLSLDYVDDYRTPAGGVVDAWTRLDAQLTWRFDADAGEAGTDLTLSVRNLLDAEPPFYDAPSGFGFDAAQADPLGRVVALQLIRRW